MVIRLSILLLFVSCASVPERYRSIAEVPDHQFYESINGENKK